MRYMDSYVSEMDEYKVVRVVEFRGFDWGYICSQANMFSSISNEWERLEPFPYALGYKRVWGAHLNGALHTVVRTDVSQWSIMAFDTRNKQHAMVPQPDFGSGDIDVTVEVFEGSLCLLNQRVTNPVDVQMDIWVMKDYGVEASWFKLVSVAVERNSDMSIYPLTYSEDGAEVLLNNNRKQLMWYNLRDGTVRKIMVDVLPLEFYTEVCVESLVSFPGIDDGKGNGQGDLKQSKQMRHKEKGKTTLSKGLSNYPKDSN